MDVLFVAVLATLALGAYIVVVNLMSSAAAGESRGIADFISNFRSMYLIAFPAGVIGSTAENLKAAAAGEQEEHTHMYPGFAQVAREEGFDAVADAWTAISVAEKQHEKRYRDLAANVENE